MVSGENVDRRASVVLRPLSIGGEFLTLALREQSICIGNKPEERQLLVFQRHVKMAHNVGASQRTPSLAPS
jgi:hypothetical protein